MASEDEHPLLEQSAEIGDHGFWCAQATPDIEHTLARFREPQQMWKRDHHSDDPGEPGISRAKAGARTPVHKREQRQQADQEQTRIGRQQQQTDLDRKRHPISAPPLSNRPPIVEQDDSPQGHRQHDRAEFRGWHREGRHAGHEQHGECGLLRTHGRAPELEHCPVGHHHADLREQVDAEQMVSA